MIFIKDKNKNNVIQIQKPFNIESEYYTILMQNTVTKEIYQFTVKDNTRWNKMYYTFEINPISLTDGEYYVLLLANPMELIINVEYNNINNIKEDERIKEILKNNNNILTNDMFILINEENPTTLIFLMNKGAIITNGDIYIANSQHNGIKIITKELMKVGTYEKPSTQYNNQTKYKTYNG